MAFPTIVKLSFEIVSDVLPCHAGGKSPREDGVHQPLDHSSSSTRARLAQRRFSSASVLRRASNP